MASLPAVNRDQMAEEEHEDFDSIVGTRGSIRGPYGVLLHSPKLAARVADTGAFVRYEFGIRENLKETVIIATGKEMRTERGRGGRGGLLCYMSGRAQKATHVP